jgi:hypothetical protein
VQPARKPSGEAPDVPLRVAYHTAVTRIDLIVPIRCRTASTVHHTRSIAGFSATSLTTCDNATKKGHDSHLLPGNGFAHLDTRGKICIRASRVSTGNDLHAGENVIHQSDVPDCNKYRAFQTIVDLVKYNPRPSLATGTHGRKPHAPERKQYHTLEHPPPSVATSITRTKATRSRAQQVHHTRTPGLP